MSYPRYLAIAGAGDPFGTKRQVAERVEALSSMRPILATPRLQLFSDAAAPVLLHEGAGAILGPVHLRPPATLPMPQPGEEESGLIVSTRGARLIQEFWGNYVAFLDNREAERACVLRAPMGGLDCLCLAWRGITLVASDLALLRAVTGLPFPPDWEMVAAFLATEGLRRQRSCLTGVEELLWGERLVVSREGMAREQAWSPWSFTPARRSGHLFQPARSGPNFETAARQLRETAIGVIGAQARDQGPILAMLSGGLDSSILAACLAASKCDVTCLNLTTGDPGGDERRYARMAASALDVPLIEAGHDAGTIDLSLSHAAGCVRPVARGFYQATRRCKQAAAEALGSRVVFDGGGGDNLFCSMQSTRPIADYLCTRGPGPGAWQTAISIAKLTETDIPTLLRRTVIQAWLRSPRWYWPCHEQFLTPHALELSGKPVHRWLDAPHGALPGSAAHIALMIGVENLLDTREDTIAERAPLMAQPLVELCLSFPSWFWFRNGHNRAVAREAFAPLLPRELACRRTKGTPDGFVTRLYDANRSVLKDLLGEGLLVSQGLVDRETVLAALSRPGPVKGNEHLALLKIADVEAWARSVHSATATM